MPLGRASRALCCAAQAARRSRAASSAVEREYHALLRQPAAAARKALVTGADGAPVPRWSGCSPPAPTRTCRRSSAISVVTTWRRRSPPRRGRCRPRAARGDPRGHDQGLGAADGRRSHEPRRPPAPRARSRRCATALRRAAGRGVGGLPRGQRRGRLHPRAAARSIAAARAAGRRHRDPGDLGDEPAGTTSTQEAFGRVLGGSAAFPRATVWSRCRPTWRSRPTSPGWINRKGVYARPARPNPFAEIPQAMQWRESPRASTSSSASPSTTSSCCWGRWASPARWAGETLLPIGTLYDPFVTRGLDALYHALYSGARFVVAATPSA